MSAEDPGLALSSAGRALLRLAKDRGPIKIPQTGELEKPEIQTHLLNYHLQEILPCLKSLDKMNSLPQELSVSGCSDHSDTELVLEEWQQQLTTCRKCRFSGQGPDSEPRGWGQPLGFNKCSR